MLKMASIKCIRTVPKNFNRNREPIIIWATTSTRGICRPPVNLNPSANRIITFTKHKILIFTLITMVELKLGFEKNNY